MAMTLKQRRALIALLAALAALPLASSRAAVPGSVDRSFGRDGRVVTDLFGGTDRATDVLAQRNGKLLVAGTARWRSHRGSLISPALVRYRPGGKLDASFAGDGKALVRIFYPSGEQGTRFCSQFRGETATIARAPGRRIVLASSCASEVGVARFRRDGRLDRSFGRRGVTSLAISPGLNHVLDVAVTADARVVVTGFTRGAGGGVDQLILARFRRDGRLDRSFGEGGAIVTDFGTGTYVNGEGLAIQDDGKLVVSGTVGNNWIVARFHEDGELDASFSDDGIAYTAPALIGNAWDVAIDRRGPIVAGGESKGSGFVSVFGLARYLPDGSLDERFGNAGTVRTPFGAERPAGAQGLAIERDGKIVLAGTALNGPPGPGSEQRFALARYRRSGRLDPSFGSNGRVTSGFHRSSVEDDSSRAVAVQPGGSIVAAGYSTADAESDFGLIRYLADP
jgi:uncharacterized delta-60 repeat protein